MKELVIIAPMSRVWSLIDDVKTAGLIPDIDFNFRYSQATTDPDTYQEISPSKVTFKFNDDKWATMFSLKWS